MAESGHPEWGAARQAALQVLQHNTKGPFQGLPRTAGWGYPEPYTRDLMISALGVLVSDDQSLVDALHRTLVALAENQSPLGHIPSLAHDPGDKGASDTTPLFLIALALYRETCGHADFLDEAAQKAMVWMQYQSPDNGVMVAQLPTSDWRDEQWVLGYGLYVNALVYLYLQLYGKDEQACQLLEAIGRLDIRGKRAGKISHEGLRIREKPYYALWSYKILQSERFDLLGNSLAILGGLVPSKRAGKIIDWVEEGCEELRHRGQLAGDLPPCLMPYIQPGDDEWRPRYDQYNRPGEYHNGGVWPFVCGFYVAALVKAGRQKLAEEKLEALTRLVRPSRRQGLAYGFNEWFRAQDGQPMGQDWQTWSAAMYLYTLAAVKVGKLPLLGNIG
jgi:glycogen debranching enzyme